ncbi:MAG: hypothetical protein AB1938_16785 [Myxococcota bacterium]
MRLPPALTVVCCLASSWTALAAPPKEGIPAEKTQPATKCPSPVPAKELGQHVGQTVCVRARLAVEIHQHLVSTVEGKKAQYVDVEAGGQYVAHAAEKLECEGTLELTARVVEVRGRSKRPGKQQDVVELALDVQAWRCLRSP